MGPFNKLLQALPLLSNPKPGHFRAASVTPWVYVVLYVVLCVWKVLTVRLPLVTPSNEMPRALRWWLGRASELHYHHRRVHLVGCGCIWKCRRSSGQELACNAAQSACSWLVGSVALCRPQKLFGLGVRQVQCVACEGWAQPAPGLTCALR